MTIRFFDTAMYAPAIQPGYLSVASGNGTGALPSWLIASDLDFLQQHSPLFHHPIALYSVGHVTNYTAPLPQMLETCDRKETVILGDSGGFQIGTGARIVDDATDLQPIFDWLVKNTDIAMTIDVPAWTVSKEETKWTTAKECLADTLPFLDFLVLANKGIDHPFLNVVQGECLSDAIEWYEAVKHFDFYGWAFAGEIKEDLNITMNLIARILRDFEGKYREGDLWLHFLGISDLQTFVILNALQANLRERLGHDRVQVTFDTSSPFQSAGMYGQYNCPPVFKDAKDNWTMSMNAVDFQPLSEYGACDPFPSQNSGVSLKTEMGDLIINRNDGKGNRFNSIATAIVANHNLEVCLAGYQTAAKRISAPRFKRKSLIPPNLVDACDCMAFLLTLPTDIAAGDLHANAVDWIDMGLSEEPAPIMFDELSDSKTIKTFAQARLMAKSKPWWKIFNFKKPGRKSK